MSDETVDTPPARRRRRATAPAGSPAPVSPDRPVDEAAEQSAEQAAQASEQLAGPEAAQEPDGSPADATDEVADQAAEDEAAEDEAAEEPASAEVVDEPQPEPEKPAAKRSRKRRATSDVAADESASPVEEDATVEPAPAKKRRGGKSTKAAKAAKADESASDEAASAEDGADEAEQPTLDVLAELGARSATALLFQAPEPVRSRRAQAPAGPPTGDDEQAATEAEAEESPEAGEAEARPRRRRGSRRKSTKREDEAAEVEEVGDAETGDAPRGDLAEDAEGDEADEAEDGDEAGTEDEGEEPKEGSRRRRRRRGGRGRRRSGASDTEDAGEPDADDEAEDVEEADEGEEGSASSRRRRRRRRSGRAEGERRSDEVTALKGSTRLEAKRQRRREGRDAGRRRAVLTEAEFLARREAVERTMIVRELGGRVQIAVLEDGVLVEHFVSRAGDGHGPASMIGNVYLGRVQNVLPSMEAAFVDIGKGRNAVLYAGEVNWDAAGLEGQPRRIEQALKSGDSVLVQVTKDPIGHKGARLTSQVTLAGRYLVYVPNGGMTGISRKLPENERTRLKKLLREIVPDGAGVIVRTAAEGASEDELRRDVKRLQDQWAAIEKKQKSASAPALLQGEPDLAIRVVRDIFNDDFTSLVVQGEEVWTLIHDYVSAMAPDLVERVSRWTTDGDAFGVHRIDEQLAKAMDRKVWLPSGGSLVIDRTEAMTVIDVNTGKFTGTGGTLEETVTRNNLEAAEEIVRQLRLRDVGGIIVIDFIDMVLESNRDLVLRRLVECLGRDRTKHQVAEVTSLGLVQMTRKRVGQGLVEAFSETCQHCAGRGYLIRNEPVDGRGNGEPQGDAEPKRSRRGKRQQPATPAAPVPVLPEAREAVKATLATIAAAAAHAHEHPPVAPAEVEVMAELDDAEAAEAVEATEVVEVVEVTEAVEVVEGGTEPIDVPVSEPVAEPIEGSEAVDDLPAPAEAAEAPQEGEQTGEQAGEQTGEQTQS